MNCKRRPGDCDVVVTYVAHACWKPCLYSCSKGGMVSCLRLNVLLSRRMRASVGGSLQSGINTINDRGSLLSASKLCNIHIDKCNNTSIL